MQISKALVPITFLTPVRNAQFGDELARDSYTPDGQKIASSGDEIDQKLLNRLENLDVRNLWVYRRVPEWMPLFEANFKNHERDENRSVSPLHFQILVNLQGTFSTEGLIELLDRLRDVPELEEKSTGLVSLMEEARELEEDEVNLKKKIEQADPDRREFFQQLLESSRPQIINPGELSSDEATLARRIQTFLQKLKKFTARLSEFVLDCPAEQLENLIQLDHLEEYEESSNVLDSFVMFDRLYDIPQVDLEWTLELTQETRNLLNELFYQHNLNEDLLNSITDTIWNMIPEELPHWILTLAKPGDPRGYLMSHGINTALICSGLCRSRDWEPPEEKRQITLACLTLDIGMMLLPQSFHLHRGDLTEDQRRSLKIHPLVSEDFLSDLCPGLTTSRDLVEKHHERLGGNGYPRASAKLSETLGLIIVSEIYDAMTSPRMWRNAIPPTETLEELHNLSGDELPARWVREILRSIGYYPVGSVVRLTNDQPALITGLNASEPDKPTVIKISDLMGDNLDEQFQIDKTEIGIQAGGTSLKAPKAIRKRFLEATTDLNLVD